MQMKRMSDFNFIYDYKYLILKIGAANKEIFYLGIISLIKILHVIYAS